MNPPKEFATKEEALQHISDIALAMKEGKRIEYFMCNHNCWLPGENQTYLLSVNPRLFRIKPEPREWWEVRTVEANRIVDTFSYLPAAKEWMKNYNDKPVRLFKVTEVIE